MYLTNPKKYKSPFIFRTSLSRYFKGDNVTDIPLFAVTGTVEMMNKEYRPQLCRRGVHYGIADNWPRIIENKVLRDEVARHLSNYAGLKEASRKLRLALKDSPKTERNLFGESIRRIITIFVFRANKSAMTKPLNRLKVVLAEQCKTNKWLAEQLGKDVTTVSKWCTNRSQPRLETLYDIAKCLNIDVKDLLYSKNLNKNEQPIPHSKVG